MVEAMWSTSGVSLVVLSYYAASTINSCLTKQILLSYPRPLTVTVVQQTLTSVAAIVQSSSPLRLHHYARAVLPVSASLVTSLVSYRVSLLYNAVSFSQVVKGLQPLFALMMSHSLLSERSNTARNLSLLLLVAGASKSGAARGYV